MAEFLEGLKLDFYINAHVDEVKPSTVYKVVSDKVSDNFATYEFEVFEDIDSGEAISSDGFAFFDEDGNLIEVIGAVITGPKKKGIIYTNGYLNTRGFSSYERIPAECY